MKFSLICKSFLIMLCTDEQEMCASRAIYLTKRCLCGRSSWLCTKRLDVFSITCWPWSTNTNKVFNTTKFVDFFSSKWFKSPREHFLFGNSLRNSLVGVSKARTRVTASVRVKVRVQMQMPEDGTGGLGLGYGWGACTASDRKNGCELNVYCTI